MNDYNFGNFVCHLREKNGLTQAEVAHRLGVTAAAVSKWENGSAKPRVEILFQLAEILGVRAEELMAGHYIEAEHLHPEAVKAINERYEYLRKIDLHNETGTKIRRLIAWLIDWNLIGFVVILAISVYGTLFIKEDSQTHALILLLLMLSYPVCFMLRDLIFGGRSLGKRILGLTVVNKQTGEAPKKSQLLLRNLLSVFILHIDAIIMLVTGLSLGDRLAHTVVISKKDMPLRDESQPSQQKMQVINQYTAQRTARAVSNRKTLIILFGVLGTVMVLFIGFVIFITNTVLERQKDTEEYQIAYTYLVESNYVKALAIEETDIKLTSYNFFQTKRNGEDYCEADFGFKVDAVKQIHVICHNEGEGWFVCTECTNFE